MMEQPSFSLGLFGIIALAALLLVVGISIAGVVIMLLPRKDRPEK